MNNFITSCKQWLDQLLYKHTIIILSVLFCVGLGVALWNMSRLSSNLIETQALQNAKISAQTLKEARTLYSENVVNKAKMIDEIHITHDYMNQKGAIPIPATYLIELGNSISANNNDILVKLYSDYPFPWRKEEGGAKDKFEEDALIYLRQNPNKKFCRIEKLNGIQNLRYAEADILKPSCVECHNTYPGTPKNDWKVGDVRGVLEIIEPLDPFIIQTRAGLRESFLILGALSILALCGLTLVITRLTQTSKELENQVKKRTYELTIEKEKSEKLLLNILPPSIAKELKEGKINIANGFNCVTILFADIVGFTKLSEAIPPQDLVNLLNEIFSAFDYLTEKYNLEKIKTIGDAYMVASGLPILRDDHAIAMSQMALEMCQEIAHFKTKHGFNISLRIGINTGAVVAGVIGKKKFIYDLWGDAVNTASRMESHGIPGMIQITQSTYDLIKDNYICKYRGKINIKGKGKMNTYLLLQKNNSY